MEGNTSTRPSNGQADTSVQTLGELLAAYVQGKITDIDQLVAYAEERARQIPKVPGLTLEVDALGTIIGELLIRLAVAEHAIDELLRQAGRPGLRAFDPRQPIRSPIQFELVELRSDLDELRKRVGGD